MRDVHNEGGYACVDVGGRGYIGNLCNLLLKFAVNIKLCLKKKKRLSK